MSRRRLVAAGAALTAAAALTAHGIGTAQAAPTNDSTCNTVVNGSPANPAGPATNAYALNVGGASEFATVYDPAGNTQAAFPYLVGADSVTSSGQPFRRLQAAFSLNPDSSTADARGGQIESDDGGTTWPASTYVQDDTTKAPPTTGATRLRDGTLLGFGFKPSSQSGTSATYSAYRSADGLTWTESAAIFDKGASGGSRITGKPLELPDGTVLILMYGQFSDGSNDRVQLEASTDGGRTFTRRAIVFKDNSTNDYNEADIAQLQSGKLISVARHHANEALASPAYTTSTDGGRTWAAIATLSVTFPNGYDPYDDSGKALLGVSPNLMLMPNGVLVLRSGRPDGWVAISTNGEGTGWVGQLTYRNCPSDGARTHGSTGYGGLDYVSANRAVVIGDNCELTWSCVTAGETDFTIDKQSRVWRRWVDVLTPDVGRIDLATKYRKGKITVGGDMTSTVDGHPRARVDGAFDGSTEYWSSAVHAGGAGTFIVNLDRSYPLTKVGLSLRNGRPASGRVYTSADGVTWGSPVATVTNRTDLAMSYTTLGAPTPARFVKVELDASSTCEAGLGTGCAFLNELELYSSVDSFENDPVNNRPRGFSNITQSWQTQHTADLDDNDSTGALRIVDTTSAQSQVTWAAPASATRTLEFRLKPVKLLGFCFDLHGQNTGVTAYHLAVNADGSIRRYNGSSWVALTAAGAVKEGRWSTIKVTATTTSASIALNGTTVATNVPVTSAASSLTGFLFASNGSSSSGDDYLVDDVLLTA
jgi:hypothetical protein